MSRWKFYMSIYFQQKISLIFEVGLYIQSLEQSGKPEKWNFKWSGKCPRKISFCELGNLICGKDLKNCSIILYTATINHLFQKTNMMLCIKDAWKSWTLGQGILKAIFVWNSAYWKNILCQPNEWYLLFNNAQIIVTSWTFRVFWRGPNQVLYA